MDVKDSLTRSIDGTPSDADLALNFNNPYHRMLPDLLSSDPVINAKLQDFRKVMNQVKDLDGLPYSGSVTKTYYYRAAGVFRSCVCKFNFA